MRAGTLRNRITIQSEQPVQDTYGEEIMAWQNHAIVWAAIEPITGNERYVNASDQIIAESTTKIRVRRRDDLNTRMRVSWTGHIFQILGIVEIEMRRREMWLFCKELNEETAG